MKGQWPKPEIDHKDNNQSNNAFRNLREATGAQNLQNKKRAHRNNKLGVLGVRRHVKGLYQARIRADNKERSLGYFKTADAAHEAYLKAKKKLHPYQELVQ